MDEFQKPPKHINCKVAHSELKTPGELLSAILLSRGVLSPNKLSTLALSIFAEAYVKELVRQKEEAQGIPAGPTNAPGSWEELEKALGKDIVQQMRNGE